MLVNSLKKAFELPSLKLFAVMVIGICAIIASVGFTTNRSELTKKRINIALRAIGHNLLLQTGDSTSLVPPVIEKSPGVFVLTFENEFAFRPETLVAITERFLVKSDYPGYTITVHECNRPAIIYGFEIDSKTGNLVPCGRRNHPKACYNIEIAFAEDAPSMITTQSAALIIAVVTLIAIVLIRKKSGFEAPTPVPETIEEAGEKTAELPSIGKFIFDERRATLESEGQIIVLTDKECRILALLHRNIGELTLREDLVREVWTEEGVITGRSLDVFISKLRKKLSGDPNLRITNLHGKGYRLETIG